MHARIVPLLALLGGSVLIACWSFALDAHISGWYKLAQQYSAPTPFAGAKWRFQTASFRRFSSYWLTLTVGASRTGLYLAQCWPWSSTHPPLLIPWADVEFEERRWYQISGRAILVGRGPPVRVSMSRQTVAQIRRVRDEDSGSA